jgi:hypothetical protein
LTRKSWVPTLTPDKTGLADWTKSDIAEVLFCEQGANDTPLVAPAGFDCNHRDAQATIRVSHEG